MGWIGETVGGALGDIAGGLIGGAIGQQGGGRKVGRDIGSWAGGFLPFAQGGVIGYLPRDLTRPQMQMAFKPMTKGGVVRPERMQAPPPAPRAMAKGGVARINPKPYLMGMAMGGMVEERKMRRRRR